jgi:ATP-dependent Clp protease ATP-binding subunit ClpB
MDELRGAFRPEFLNRLDETILFKPLTKENVGGIIKLLVKDLNARIEDKGITVELTQAAEDYVVDKGYDPAYGARPLKRYLQRNVETMAAREMLSQTITDGDTLLIDVKDGELCAQKK